MQNFTCWTLRLFTVSWSLPKNIFSARLRLRGKQIEFEFAREIKFQRIWLQFSIKFIAIKLCVYFNEKSKSKRQVANRCEWQWNERHSENNTPIHTEIDIIEWPDKTKSTKMIQKENKYSQPEPNLKQFILWQLNFMC